MSTDYREIFDLAKALDGLDSKPEALLRAIIGRAYYAAFHHASSLATDRLGAVLEDIEASMHKRLFISLKDYSTKDPVLKYKLQKISRELKRLHSHRVAADYTLMRSIGQDLVDSMLDDVGRLLKNIDELEIPEAA